MSTPKDNETSATTTQPADTTPPDGKSELPGDLDDYEPPTSSSSGDSGSSTGG